MNTNAINGLPIYKKVELYMSQAEYIVTFESILYGLIVSQFLIGWNRLIRDYGQYKGYWAHIVTSVSLFLIMVMCYWIFQNQVRFEDMNRALPFLLLGILPPALFTTAAFQLFPKKIKGLDLKVYLMQARFKILVPAALYFAIVILYITSKAGLDHTTALAIAFILISSILLLKKSYIILEALSILTLIFAIYIFIERYIWEILN